MTDLAVFRDETRNWLEENCPPEMKKPMTPHGMTWGGRNCKFTHPEQELSLKRLYEKGRTAPTRPKEYGGGGLNFDENKVLAEEMNKMGTRMPLASFGLWMLGPALLEYASEEQKMEHIPKIIKGEIRWCQGYSEPGSGSDLASLKTKAIEDGDNFVVNGQKVWTSGAHYSDYGILVVRHDASLQKHKGLTFFFVDMKSPGITVKPIKQITGTAGSGAGFNEVYFDRGEHKYHGRIKAFAETLRKNGLKF